MRDSTVPSDLRPFGIDHDGDGRDPGLGTDQGAPVTHSPLVAATLPLSLSSQISSAPFMPPPLPFRRTYPRRSTRPSTASSVEDKSFLLPSTAAAAVSEGPTPIPSPSVDPASSPALSLRPDYFSPTDPTHDLEPSHPRPPPPDQEDMLKRALSDSGHLVLNPSHPAHPPPAQPPLQRHHSDPGDGDYDWATFIGAYAHGHWDPHKTPNPPRSYFELSFPPSLPPSSAPSSPKLPPKDLTLTPPTPNPSIALTSSPSSFTDPDPLNIALLRPD
ncbi:hypothetical protein OF83DRAFT_1089204, partial [Amylostereum chailletii]